MLFFEAETFLLFSSNYLEVKTLGTEVGNFWTETSKYPNFQVFILKRRIILKILFLPDETGDLHFPILKKLNQRTQEINLRIYSPSPTENVSQCLCQGDKFENYYASDDKEWRRVKIVVLKPRCELVLIKLHTQPAVNRNPYTQELSAGLQQREPKATKVPRPGSVFLSNIHMFPLRGVFCKNLPAGLSGLYREFL